ncbi:preprotein translocase subunit SecG [Rickettsiales bacterium LUAb2]
MLTTLYVIQFIISALLIICIFFQKREEVTSLISSNVYNSMFKSVAVPSNPLTKITFILGALFFINSVFIGGVLIKHSKTDSKVIQNVEKYSTEKSNVTKTNNVNKPNNSKANNNPNKLPSVPLGN